MRRFIVAANRLKSGDNEKDHQNREISFGNLIADKLADELVGRLSELAEAKVGQLTFHFAAQKLKQLGDETKSFNDFIVKSKIREKRNRDVSHKQLPEQWNQKKLLYVNYRTLLRAVTLALRLMKRIDRIVLGPSAPYLWRVARKKRYEYMSPPRASYMLVPYHNLSGDDRIAIVGQELSEGKPVLTKLATKVNGQPATILVSKQWSVIFPGNRALALARYPLIELEGITFEPDVEGAAEAAPRVDE
jgi:hypothetical protein